MGTNTEEVQNSDSNSNKHLNQNLNHSPTFNLSTQNVDSNQSAIPALQPQFNFNLEHATPLDISRLPNQPNIQAQPNAADATTASNEPTMKKRASVSESFNWALSSLTNLAE